MSHSVLKVGIIGASPGRSWADLSHVPALKQLDGLTLAAVATSSEESARAASDAYGIPAYADTETLINSEDVDIVSICVRVPKHKDLVLAALAAGKHVYCEWPLGVTTAEAEELRQAAEKTSVHAVIGLQGRMSLAARQARTLIELGRLGRLLTAHVFSPTGAFGPETSASNAYLNDPANGATLTTILGGHTMALATSLLGEVVSVDALAETQFAEVRLTDKEGSISRHTLDNLSVLTRHESGCVLTAEIAGYRPDKLVFSLEVVGTEGKLELTSGSAVGFQADRLTLHTDLPLIDVSRPVPEAVSAALPEMAVNVAEVYAQMAEDIHHGTHLAPGFSDAVRLTRLITAVTEAAETGMRQKFA